MAPLGCTLLAAGLALGAIAMPGVAVASTPAQDQYTVNLPTPHGQKPTGGQNPVSHPNNLTPSQQHAASGPDKSQLTQIATSPQLGAPNTNGAGGTKGETSSGGSSHHSSNEPASGKGGSGKGGTGHQGEGTARALDLAGKSPAAPAAIVDAAGGAPGIGLLAALLAITVAAAVSFIVRRRRASR
jgi:hypothetical protein